MSDKTVVNIQVSGPEHSGKTSVIALVTTMLRRIGIEVVVQRADPQMDEKFQHYNESLERSKNVLVKISEMQTAR